jgi:UV DNA damage endonuclease
MARTKTEIRGARTRAPARNRAATRTRFGGASRIRWGLCCQFANQPIHFRAATATALMRLTTPDRRLKLSQLCLANAEALLESLKYCAANGIGCFRIASTILPVKTHPIVGYSVDDLPHAAVIIQTFQECGAFAAQHKIRTVFHPDQFVVLNSPRADVVDKSIQDLEYHAQIGEWVQADVINIHGGGAYGDKATALRSFVRNLERLSPAVRSRLTVENDDKIYTPSDLLPVCRAAGLPLVYDVHHHRCLPDRLTVEQATALTIKTWDREPLFHLSSPLEGWTGPQPHRHHDYIDASDFPQCWRSLKATVEVEAKAKELAVARLRHALGVPASGVTASVAARKSKRKSNSQSVPQQGSKRS